MGELYHWLGKIALIPCPFPAMRREKLNKREGNFAYGFNISKTKTSITGLRMVR